MDSPEERRAEAMRRKSFPGSPPIELKGREIESSLTPKAQPMPAPPPRPRSRRPPKKMTRTSQPSDSTMRTLPPARDASKSAHGARRRRKTEQNASRRGRGARHRFERRLRGVPRLPPVEWIAGRRRLAARRRIISVFKKGPARPRLHGALLGARGAAVRNSRPRRSAAATSL